MTFQRSLRTAPAPLGYFWLGIGPALAGNVGTGGAFALSREGGSGCRRSNACSDPISLPPGAIRLSIGVWKDLGGGPAGGGVEAHATTRVRQKYGLIYASIAIP